MYKSQIVGRLVNITGNEKSALTTLRSLGFLRKRIENLSEFEPNSLEERSIDLYLRNRKLHAKCYFFSQQLIKYDKLCLSLGVDAEFRNQKFEYDEDTGEIINQKEDQNESRTCGISTNWEEK